MTVSLSNAMFLSPLWENAVTIEPSFLKVLDLVNRQSLVWNSLLFCHRLVLSLKSNLLLVRFCYVSQPRVLYAGVLVGLFNIQCVAVFSFRLNSLGCVNSSLPTTEWLSSSTVKNIVL
jgi:hypothetical protein